VAILPNAVDPEEWQLRRVLQRDVVNIAAVMRLAPRKRGTALLRALSLVCGLLPPGIRVRLHIAGDGQERGKLERLARQLGLGDVVLFHGALPLPAVKLLLSQSHFLVQPSTLEAFGIAALEARAAGLPVVAMRESGVSEFIHHGEDGLLAKDDEELAQHIFLLCINDAIRSALTEHNVRTPVAFTWERTVAAHLAMYERARHLCSMK
jgi:glycosyltransferase involved in cell wall biosynthesis